MPHFSADLLDALLDGDPAERAALRAILGGQPAVPAADQAPDRGADTPPAPGWEPRPSPLLRPAARLETPAKSPAVCPPPEARNTGRRPGLPALPSRGGRGHPARHGSGR